MEQSALHHWVVIPDLTNLQTCQQLRDAVSADIPGMASGE
jgi:hypothetical protein